ncbi:MAG: hypothetical protein FD123_3806 [Bacteroidetes bacterium]|nr:MAG: hypothetical protein FD123_3806 [Bacteroidota bacterium]
MRILAVESMIMGTFRCKTGTDGQFYFSLLAANNEVILSGEGYNSKSALLNGLAAVRRYSLDDRFFIRENAAGGQCYFILVASNGETLGRSELYNSVAARENGVKAVMQEAHYAVIREE